MAGNLGPSYWERFNKLSVFTSGFAFLLVYFSAALGEEFDWMVFFLSGVAALVCWWRSEFLVPAHKRHEDAEDEMWRRFQETDWRFVSAVAGLTGSEIDRLREVFRTGSDKKARDWIEGHWPMFSDEDIQGFIRFFNEEFMDTISAYIDENGRLQPFD